MRIENDRPKKVARGFPCHESFSDYRGTTRPIVSEVQRLSIFQLKRGRNQKFAKEHEPMKKALPLMFLLLSGICFAQTVCTNNEDSKGSICTNFTTLPHGYVQSSTIPPFLIDTEDGQASSGGNAVNFTQPYNAVYVTLPFDPLKIEGLVQSYGTNETSLLGLSAN
jgi:hypothetical protein